MYLPSRSVQSKNRLTAALLLVGLFVTIPAWSDKGGGSEDINAQLGFGIEMARRGLWNEAAFRFSRVLQERPGDVRVLNNMAVAYEATGQFDLALEYYKKALKGDSTNRDLRRNYAQFVEFYESLKPKTEADPAPEATEASGADDTAKTSDSTSEPE